MYQVFIGYVPLPIAPAKIDTVYPNRNETISLINGEQINILKSPGLVEVSFDFLIPHQSYPFTTFAGSLANSITGALGSLSSLANTALSSGILEYLKYLKTSKEPTYLVIVRLGEGLTMTTATTNAVLKVSLEDYTIKEDAEEYGLDTCVSVLFKEYRPYSTKILSDDGNIIKKRG